MGSQHRAVQSIVGLGVGVIAPLLTVAYALAASRSPVAVRPAFEMLSERAIAQDTQEPTPPAPEPEPDGAVETLTLPNQFSLMIPEGWTTETVDAEGYAVITSYLPGEAIQSVDVRTEVTLVDEPPETFVGKEIDALVQQNYRIRNYGVAAVQGNQALRLWIIDRPDDFTNQVITFVGEANRRTSKIISYYNDDSPEAVATILDIHQSFQFIADGSTDE